MVNAANCWGPELCDKIGMRVPAYPMRRLTFYFEVRERLEMMPLGAVAMRVGICWRGLRWDENTGSGSE